MGRNALEVGDGQNTFELDFEPITLNRMNDWLAFEGTFEASCDRPPTLESRATSA
jgi:hypothetical protein